MPVKVLLQEVRKSKGLSQNELARLIHMSPQNIQKIEQGDAKSLTFITLERLCKVFNCQPGDLLIYQDEPEKDDQRAKGEQEEFKHKRKPAQNNPYHKQQHTHSFLTVFTDDARESA